MSTVRATVRHVSSQLLADRQGTGQAVAVRDGVEICEGVPGSNGLFDGRHCRVVVAVAGEAAGEVLSATPRTGVERRAASDVDCFLAGSHGGGVVTRP